MPHTNHDSNYEACIMGASLDVGNMGVRALGHSLACLILRKHPNARIQFLYGNQTGGERWIQWNGSNVSLKIINCRMSPRSRLSEHILWILLLSLLYRCLPLGIIRRKILRSNAWINAIATSNLVGDIRGGDSFSDIYGVSRFISGSLPIVSAILLGRRPVLFPQTYGPFRSFVAKSLARFILRHSDRIYSRDYASLNLIADLTGGSEEVCPEFCPEIAFTLPTMKPSLVDLEALREWKGQSNVVGINISGLLYIGGYTRNNMFGLSGDYRAFIRGLFDEFLKIPNIKILLIPHVFDNSEENDIAACREFYQSLPHLTEDRIQWIDAYCNQSEIKTIIGLCDFFIGSRMHACVAAMSQGIPSIGLAYSDKFDGVFRSIGLESMVLDARKQSREDLIKNCLSRFKDREATRTLLCGRIPAFQQQILKVFERMLSEERNMNYDNAATPAAVNAG